jgi:predicted TIM-barrel fold metal-dependent hydrolase
MAADPDFRRGFARLSRHDLSFDAWLEVYANWRRDLRKLAGCANVFVKLGGFGLSVSGLDFHRLPVPPSSEELADAWRPYVETCIEAFGPNRCMFESNFPVDKAVSPYLVVWNACKRLASGASKGRSRLIANAADRR